MREKLAMELYPERVDQDAPWEYLNEAAKEYWRRKVDAILDALMEPSEEMVNAVTDVEHSECIGFEGREEIWVHLNDDEAREAIRNAIKAAKASP